MPRFTRSFLTRTGLAIVAFAAAVGTAKAQVGVGVGIYPYGSYNGFWSNGFSLYGPPVPSYGSVPGYFGGSDQRLYNFSNINIQNGASFGLGTPGAGGAGPWRRYSSTGQAASPPPAGGQATIDVRVPAADAEVSFEGNNTRQTGPRRLFQSPMVEAGQTFFYKIRAKWKRPDGTVVDQERTVGVRANETTVVDFTAPVANNPVPVAAR
jgi:uncharacterized protein (TIGR03000 family)